MKYYLAAEGPGIRKEQDALDLIGEARHQGAGTVVVPVERFEEDFFRLRSGVAGAIFNKFATYGVRLIVVGDISRYVNASDAFRDLVYETNRGQHVWFCATSEEALNGISR